MGYIILTVALITEVAFAFYAIRTGENQSRLRSIIRISAWVVFTGGLLTSVIEWSFRWYFLFGLLSILAAIGVVRLWTKNYGQKPFRKGKIVLKGISLFMMFFFSALSGILFPQYELPEVTGNLDVLTESYTFTDPDRIETFTDTGKHRKLNVEFYYPDAVNEKFPLIIFSHGAFGVKMSNTSTFMELASNGYIVCSIDHPYHAAGTMDDEGNLTIGSRDFMQEVIDVNGDVYNEKEQFELYEKWMNLRTGDMNFVLNEILEKSENTSAKIYDLIDGEKIGLMGHSLGGAASAQLGRDRDDISAVIDIDGSMLGEYDLNEKGDTVINDVPYPLPLLNFYSEYVLTELEKDPDYVYVNQYISSISTDAYETCIKGTNHMSYTDLPLFSPFLASQLSGISGGSTEASVDEYYCIETMNHLIVEFFDCFLKDYGAFAAEKLY